MPTPVTNLDLERLKDQLLITLAKRLQKENKITIPCKELDDTGQDMLFFEVDQETLIFTLTLSKKS